MTKVLGQEEGRGAILPACVNPAYLSRDMGRVPNGQRVSSAEAYEGLGPLGHWSASLSLCPLSPRGALAGNRELAA